MLGKSMLYDLCVCLILSYTIIIMSYNVLDNDVSFRSDFLHRISISKFKVTNKTINLKNLYFLFAQLKDVSLYYSFVLNGYIQMLCNERNGYLH